MKKGSVQLAEEIVEMLPKVILVSLVLILFFFITSVYLSRDVNTSDLEYTLLTQRLFYSQDCFSLQEERIHPGIIDLSKFQEERLQKCAFKDRIGYSLDLKNIDDTLIKSVEVNPSVSAYYDFCDVKKKNFQCYHRKDFVIVEDQGVQSNAFLETFVVVQDA